jgi:hypothetical protein
MSRFNSIKPIPDDPRLFVTRRDFSGGMNSRVHPNRLAENQGEDLTNWDLSTPAQLTKAKGSVMISDDMGDESVVGLHDYKRQGYTDVLLAFEDDNLNDITSEGNHSEVKGDFTASQTDIGFVQAKESGLTPDDVAFINVGGNNWWRVHKDSSDSWATQDLGNTSGTGSDSPPASTVGAWYGNRFWVLKDDLLYFSDAYDSDYSTSFDTTSNVFRIPVGEERGIVATRDKGMIIMGKQAIWNLFPSATPAATDRPEPIVSSHGVVGKRAWCVAGDNIYYFAQDGLRELRRTVTDDIQSGTTYPLSYHLKRELESIDWAYASRIIVHYFDNKVFIVVPTSSSAFETWIFYPTFNAFVKMDGWSPRSMSNHTISGEQRMYYGLHGDGKVYRGWYGYTDEGTTTTDGTAKSTVCEGRQEDFKQPLEKKCGGEIEIEAFSTGGDYSLTIKVAVDGGAYSTLGTMDLETGDAPTLPVDLSFQLSDNYLMRKKFHLDGLGSFRQIQVKIEDSNANDEDIKLYGINIITFKEEYEDET